MAWKGTAVVPGPAHSMGSKRLLPAGPEGAKKPVLVDADKGLRGWQKALRLAMLAQAPGAPIDGPVRVAIVVLRARPQDHFGRGRNAGLLKSGAPRFAATGKDIDKVARAVLDSGTGLWWVDDRRVVDLRVTRLYADAQDERTEVSACEET